MSVIYRWTDVRTIKKYCAHIANAYFGKCVFWKVPVLGSARFEKCTSSKMRKLGNGNFVSVDIMRSAR